MAIDLNKTMRPAEIDLANKVNSIGTRLFNGTWAQGTSITVTNLDKYCFFVVYLENSNVPIFAFSPPNATTFRGGVGYISGTPVPYLYTVIATRSGNTLTLTYGQYYNVKTQAVTQRSVSEIYGII